MSFFDEAYDDMSWQEICYRLPSDLAVRAIKRRVNNTETLKMLFDNVGSQPSKVKELKDHINDTVDNEDPADILDAFEGKYESTLFNWLSDHNKARIKEHDSDRLSVKFLFNVTKSDDKDGMKTILDRVLAEETINQTHLSRVLDKVDSCNFVYLLDSILKDTRNEVRASILGVSGGSNRKFIGDHQKVMALKALAKCYHYSGRISMLNIDVFSTLRPLERLVTLEKYLACFPVHNKVAAFSPVPEKEEFDLILFAGCIEHNDKVIKINEMYKAITEDDPPEVKDEEDTP